MGQKRHQVGRVRSRDVALTTKVALVLSLVASALFFVVTSTSAQAGWLVCVSLLPLFFAIRSLSPVGAMLCGGLWGGLLYGFSLLADMSSVSSALSLFLFGSGIRCRFRCRKDSPKKTLDGHGAGRV